MQTKKGTTYLRPVRRLNEGFLLPAVIFVSLAIAIMATAALSVITSLSVDQNNQYLNSVAREAAEAGAKTMLSCYAANPAVNATLTTGMTCDGASGGLDYVTSGDNWRSTFSVSPPVSVGGELKINSVGSVTLYNKANVQIGTPITISSNASIVTTGGVVASMATLANNVSVGGTGGIGSHGFPTTYAITDDGKIYSWGRDWFGTLGIGVGNTYRNTPTAVDMSAFGNEKAVSITTLAGSVSQPGASSSSFDNHGYPSVYVVSDAGNVYVWGRASNGSLGTGSSVASYDKPVAINMAAFGGRKVKSVYTLAGTVASASRATDSFGDNGYSTIYALTTDGKLYSWGRDSWGTLGNGGSAAISSTPSAVNMSAFGSEKIVSITTLAGTVSKGGTSTAADHGYSSIYALTDAGKIYSWGRDWFGTLGVGSGVTMSNVPMPVNMTAMGGKKVQSITALAGDVASGGGSSVDRGYASLYAVTEDGKIYSWGRDYFGTLGAGAGVSTSNVPIPVDMSAFGGEKAVSITTLAGAVSKPGGSTAGGSNGFSSVYAVSDTGKIYSWGRDYFGTLGAGAGVSTSNVPIPVDMSAFGARRVKSVTAIANSVASATMDTSTFSDNGFSTVYAITEDGKIYSWGRDWSGTLAIGVGNTYRSIPTAVDMSAFNGDQAVSISTLANDAARNGTSGGTVGFPSVYAVTNTGKIYSWGRDWFGSLGANVSNQSFNVPIPARINTTSSGSSAGYSLSFY
ncbi:MAG: hypothetical protein EOO17_01065 [Chloroflexi bacterium]|nr:MAG: hypothetical protein EOO17_01065 [Chloroflexota bacterium]